MTIAKPNFFSLPSASGAFDAVRSLFRARADAAPMHAAPNPVAAEMSDHSRYVRLLENELDQKHLTAVEREDMDMLDRVRDALYADD